MTNNEIENGEKEVSVKKKKRIGKTSFLLILFFILLVGVAFGLKQQIEKKSEAIKSENAAQMKKTQPDLNVVTLELTPSHIKDRISLPGVVEPWVDLTVLSEVRGKVINIATREGDSVDLGDIIAFLDKRDYQNAQKSARASYDAAVATLNRTRELYKAKLSTRSQLDSATAQAEISEAALDNAKLDLDRCTVRSPISGIVNNLFIDQGQYLNHSDPVVEIIQIRRVKVKVGIPESDVEAVRRIKNFNVRIDALNKKTYQAKKYFLSKTADPMARLYNLHLELNNEKREILPDMFARVNIVKNEVKDGLAVPLYAVITRNDKHNVFVVNDSTAHLKEVELGFQDGWQVEVKKGLVQGDKVIVMGQRNVNHEQKVQVVQNVTDPEALSN